MASRSVQIEGQWSFQRELLASGMLIGQIGLAQAADLARAGRYTEAERLLVEIPDDQETPPAALDLLARIRAQQGRLGEAESFWRQALHVDPANEVYLTGLRRIAELQRRPRWLPMRWPMSVGVAIGLLALLLWLLTQQATQITTAIEDVSGRVGALEQRIDRQSLNPTSAPSQEPSLIAAVQETLRADSDLKSAALMVRQFDHAIYLSGTVSRPELKARAEVLARATPGVDLVDSTGVTVTPPQLVPAVERALIAEARLAGLQIVTAQAGHDIRLRGKVPSVDLKQLAEKLAGEVAGVELVDSRELIVEPPSLDDAARKALKADPRTAGLQIEVEQVGASIKLKGALPSLDLQRTVESIIRGLDGIELVDSSELRVEPAFIEYIVQPGDSLVSIARKFYGDETKWPLIYAVNQNTIEQPRRLYFNSRLKIPTNISQGGR